MSPAFSIAHYRVTCKLGEGGMGEVWRATDTKLGRDVAIKILPEAFARDADRMARFTREAHVLASLNHPNIAAIYGVEERALIMELAEGPTLAGRIAHGAMPVEEALPILQQLVDALEYAHEKNIIHRDLKPANIKIAPEGKAKVLDFGLAKAMTPETLAADPASSPTLTMRDTRAGTLLGTAAYMAPEQARGHNVDKRADIWAFGVVVYEMLAGRQLFGGQTVSDTLAAVLRQEPEWDDIPVRMRRLLRLCLQKDPRNRLRDIGDARALITETVEHQPSTRPARLSVTPWIVSGVLAVALATAGAGWWRATRPVEHPLTRLSMDLGSDAVPGANLTVAISPDGRRLVFPARGPDGKQQLATRLLDELKSTLLTGTENGADPFFSPDGQWIGFFAKAELKKISVHGGVPLPLLGVLSPGGGAWGDDGNIIVASAVSGPLNRISAAGGKPQPLTKLVHGELSHRWPQILPHGEAVLFTASPSVANAENSKIEAISLKTDRIKILQQGSYGRYLPSGHLVYVHQGVLFGIRLDAERLEVQGAPTPLPDDLAANPVTGGGQFSFSGNGTMVYAAGKSAAQSTGFAWLDSSGAIRPLISEAGANSPHVSPDGQKLAFSSGGEIYIYDMERGTRTRLTIAGDAIAPIWAPDSRHIVFCSGYSLFWIRSDGAGRAQRLLDSPSPLFASSISPDGRHLAYFEMNPETDFDIWTLPLDVTDPDHPKVGKPEEYVRTLYRDALPQFSPDGRWIAYRSDETGSREIHVRPFPAAWGGRWQISNGGGLFAFWSKNGRELFYETADNQIMVVDYKVDGASFVAGKPRLWSEKRLLFVGGVNADLAPDGKRFVMLMAPETGTEKGSVHVTMLLNFFDEVKRRIP